MTTDLDTLSRKISRYVEMLASIWVSSTQVISDFAPEIRTGTSWTDAVSFNVGYCSLKLFSELISSTMVLGTELRGDSKLYH